MEQIESQENLALLDPETRTLLLICRDEGLRISEVLTLNTGCLKKTPRRAAGPGPLQELPGYPGLPGGRGRNPRANRSCQAAVRRYLPMAVPQGHGQPGAVGPELRAQLDKLLVVPEGQRRSELDLLTPPAVHAHHRRPVARARPRG